MNTSCQDLGPIPGFEDILSGSVSTSIDEEFISKVAQLTKDYNIPLTATMGAWDQLNPIINWIRGRKLVEQLPEEIVLLRWFSCHVPQDSSALINLKAMNSADLSVGFKVFGSGFGKARGLTISVTSDTEPRKKCATYSIAVRLLPKLYECDGERSIVLDVVGEAGTRVETLDLCPYCSRAPEDIDPFDYALGEYIDLRKDNVKHKLKVNLQWTENSTLDIGVDIASLKVPAALTLTSKVSSQAQWEMSYELQPGFFYQPYRMLTGPSYFPPMWAFKK